MNLKNAPVYNSGYYMQDTSYIQRKQDKKNTLPIQIYFIPFNEDSRCRPFKRGLSLARARVLWRTPDVACQTRFKVQNQEKSS